MMSRASFRLSALVLFLIGSAAALLPNASAPPASREPRAEKSRAGRIVSPLIFEQNVGQSTSEVEFLARGQGFAFALTGSEAQLGLRKPLRKRFGQPQAPTVGARVKTRLLGANPLAKIRGEKRLRASINYFFGNDRSKWLTDVPAFERVRMESAYPGIDLIHYGREDGAFEYDFEVAPGADPSQIRFAVEGAQRVSIEESGDLLIVTDAGEIRQRKPVCFQPGLDRKIPVSGEFRVTNGSTGLAGESLEGTLEVSFRLGAYDSALPLTIDPVLVYSTYLGGSSGEDGYAIAAGPDGRAYVTGDVQSIDFPLKGEYEGGDTNPSGYIYDAFVSVLDPSKSGADSLVYSTYLAGIQDERGTSIGVDRQGRAVASGWTGSGTLFPTTDIPYMRDPNHGSCWVAVLDPTKSGEESLVYSMRAEMSVTSLSTSPDGRVYIAGAGNGFLSGTATSFQSRPKGGTDGLFAIIDPEAANGQAFHYLTYIGGNSTDYVTAMDIDPDGKAYLLGNTESDQFPVTGDRFQDDPAPGMQTDLFVSILDPSLSGASSLIYSTYFGGDDTDDGTDLGIDSAGRAVIGGRTHSKNFPSTPTRWSDPEGNMDPSDMYGFLAVLDPKKDASQALAYGTFLPGSGVVQTGSLLELAVDPSGRINVASFTRRSTMELGFFFAVFDPTQSGESSLYSIEYLSHSIEDLAIGPNRRLYLTGRAGPDSLETTETRYQGSLGAFDAYVMVLEPIQTADPTDLTATALSSTKIQLSWIDHATDETGFQIERKQSNGTFARIDTVGPNVKSYLDMGLSPDTSYTYRVRYFKTGHLSRYSNHATAKTLDLPATPTGLTATTISSTRILLNWDYVNADASAVQIERKIDSSAFIVIASIHPDITTYVSSGLTPHTTYSYRIKAVRGPDVSPYSNVASATTHPVPPAPTHLTATAISSSQIELSWSAEVPAKNLGETRFEVERQAQDGSFIKRATVTARQRTFVDEGLPPVSLRTYRVRTVNAIGTSPYSNEASATTRNEDIPAPTNLEANAPGQLTVALFWEDNSANETGFKLERSLNGTQFSQVKLLSANTVQTTDTTGLQPITKYWYRVRAYKDVELSAYSNAVAVTTLPLPPAAPTGLTAQPRADGTALLKWTDQSDNETRLRVEMRLSDDGFREVANLAANTDTWTSGKLQSNRTYAFRLRTQNAGGFSAYSNTAQALSFPVSLKALTVTAPATPAGRTRLDLKWSDPNEAPSKAKLVRSKGGAPEKEVTVNAGVTTYADTGLLPSTTYQYTLTAFNATGEAVAATASGTTLAPPPPPPTAPDNLTCAILGPDSAQLKWRDRSGDEDGFKVERATAGGAFAQVAVVAANGVTWTDTRLSPTTAYRFRLRSYRGTDHSDYSGEAGGTTPTPPPTAPSSLTAKGVGLERVDLTWTDRSNNEEAFHVERATGESAFTEIGTTGAGKVSFADQNINPATTYRYRVRAINEGGFSAYSNTASVAIERLVRGALEVTGNLAFGGVKVGKRKALTLTLRNTSANERLALTIGAIDKPFKVDAGGGSAVLEPGQSRAVTVSLAPKKQKKYTGELPLQSSDPEKLNTVIGAKGAGR